MIIHFNDVYDSPASYWRVRLVWYGTIYLIIKLEGGVVVWAVPFPLHLHVFLYHLTASAFTKVRRRSVTSLLVVNPRLHTGTLNFTIKTNNR